MVAMLAAATKYNVSRCRPSVNSSASAAGTSSIWAIPKNSLRYPQIGLYRVASCKSLFFQMLLIRKHLLYTHS